MTKTTTTLLALALMACGAPAPAPAPSCGPHEDLVVVDEEVEHGISQCAVCARARRWYADRAEELGGCGPFPVGGCPTDEGLTDCSLWDAQELVTLPIERAESCGELEERASDLEAYRAVRCARQRHPEGV